MNDAIGAVLFSFVGLALGYVIVLLWRGRHDYDRATMARQGATSDRIDTLGRRLLTAHEMIGALLALRQVDREAARIRHAALRRRLFIASMGAANLEDAISRAKLRRAADKMRADYAAQRSAMRAAGKSEPAMYHVEIIKAE